MFIYLNKKAQSTAEYVIVLGLIVGAVVAMRAFVTKGLQGRLRDATNYVENPTIGNVTTNIFTGAQYDPYYLGSDFDTEQRANESENITTAGGDITRTTTEEFSNRTGNQTIGAAR